MAGALHRPPRSDVVLALVMTAVSIAELYSTYAFERASVTHPSPIHLVVAVVVGSALAWRRVYALLVGPFVFALLAAQAAVVVQPNVYGEIIIAIVALYSVTAYGPSVRSGIASGVTALGFGVLLGLNDTEDPFGSAVTMVVFGTVVLLLGWIVRRQRDQADDMRHQRDLAEARALEIAATERLRIARELHDVVAHGMSVVVLQARGGRRMVDAEPLRATCAFDDIERVASDCLDEMRRLLEILRSTEPEVPSLTPQPRIRELHALVDQAQTSGATVDLVVDGEPRELSPALELSAYRIAQEALTNALKHAPGSATRLHVTYEPEAVSIEVTDDGPGMGDGQGGHGLIGMREQVELFGGTFAADSVPSGGFCVRARLPLATIAS